MKPFDSADILFCDNHLLVALKPAGVLTQPDAVESNESLEAWAKAWVKEKYQKQGAVFLHAVHRLDKPVSGLVLFARTSKALSRLNEQLRKKEIQRIYLAEVEGILPQKFGRLDHFLLRGEHRSLVAKEGQEGAQHARLTYEVLHYMPQSTLVQVELDTGRYHQIRAQFAAIGHPVVGDRRYGGEMGRSEEIRLHSTKLALEHPITCERLTFESPPPFA